MSNLLSQLNARERARLLEELNHMNLDDVRAEDVGESRSSVSYTSDVSAPSSR